MIFHLLFKFDKKEMYWTLLALGGGFGQERFGQRRCVVMGTRDCTLFDI